MTDTFNILLVDDDKDIHDVIQEALSLLAIKSAKPLHLSLDHAYQGQEALEKIKLSQESGKKIDLVILDMLMPPGINGAEVMKNIDKAEDINVLISTAYFHDLEGEVRKNANSFENVFLLQKPYSLFDFAESVKNILFKIDPLLIPTSLVHIK